MMLSISNLQTGYGKVSILNDISLAVNPGEILAVIGRNGVGKTTLMKSIIGQLPVFKGQVIFCNRDIGKLPTIHRSRLGIGYVPQGRGIFNRLTVEENLKMGETVGIDRVIQKIRSSRYDRVFNFFPTLIEKLNQRAGSLSGGQQQMLSIGRVLVGNPELILLDEPSEGIQPNIVQSLGRIIRLLKEQEQLTVLLVEQNLDLIRLAADRCIVIDKGSVVAELLPEELDNPYTAKQYLAL